MTHPTHATGRVVPLAFILACAAAGCVESGFFDTIATSSSGSGRACGAGVRVSPASIEISEGVAYSADAGPFVPLSEGASVHLVRGGQGASMIVLSLRVAQFERTICLQQRTDVLDASGMRVSFDAQPLSFVADGGGHALASAIFFPGDYRGGAVIVRVAIGDTVFTRTLSVTP
ncbi:MAG: hypothetical protein WCJ30_07530 [Deltaproteobacteria bacterium]